MIQHLTTLCFILLRRRNRDETFLDDFLIFLSFRWGKSIQIQTKMVSEETGITAKKREFLLRELITNVFLLIFFYCRFSLQTHKVESRRNWKNHTLTGHLLTFGFTRFVLYKYLYI